MKRGMRKVVGLVLILSMLFGAAGCGSLVKLPQNGTTHIEVMPEKGQNVADDAAEQQGQLTQTAENNGTEGEKKGQSDTKTEDKDEELMSDFFINKMELLEYLVEMYYMNDISVEDMRTGAYKGLLEGLGDPYTCYYTAEEYKDLMESTTGTYCGIGAVVQQNTKTMLITIVKPYVDGPAYNAGMLPGDIIYKVDGVDVSGMEIDKVVSMMKGEAGTIVKVTVVRDGVADPVELTITRAQIEIETIEHEMLDKKIGLVTISSFDEHTPKQFKDAVEELEKDGMEGLIIDLRDNGGGLLSSVVEMLDYLLPEGMIVYTEDKYGNREEFKGTDKEVFHLPTVVMINGNSASASEIFAGAMKDYEAATIVGTTSFGKGIVQTILPLTDGTAVKITISRYFTPKGVCIHGIGVAPDVEVDLKDELKQQVVIEHEDDNQLQTAIDVLLKDIRGK